MPITDDLSDMFPGTVSHAALTGRDQFGAPTYGSATSYSARLVKKNRLTRDTSGKEVVSTAQVWLLGSPDVSPEDKVTLADGSTPPIASVERFEDEDGWSHTKVFFL